MKDSLNDPELEKELTELFKKFIHDLIENPKEVNKTMGEVYPGLLSIFGIENDLLKEIVESLPKRQKNAIRDRLTSLETVFLMIPVKKLDDEFSVKVDELFEICKGKKPKKVKTIFSKPRMEIFQKMLTGFERSWRIVSEKDLPKEAVIDNKFRIVKSLSEGMYRELLMVIQEMMQLGFGYKPTDSFGAIFDQLEKAPIDLKIFVNRTAYNVRNADSHESADFEKDHTITIYDKKGKVIQRITEEDLDKTITWLTKFTNSVFHAMQKNYFDYMKIGPKDEDRIEYVKKTFTEFLLKVFSHDSQ
ncbi:MAG: hypothetical protein MUO73_03955 [Thermoplasmata archaeon]|nr:hypothetical protein [Thermoplasmata archaeon]